MKKLSATAMACGLALGVVSLAMPALAAPDPDPQSPPNRRVPDVRAGASIACLFGLADRRGDLPDARVLGTAGPDRPDDPGRERGARARDHGLSAGWRRREHRGSAKRSSKREGSSPWRASLRLNLGSVYRLTGYFSRALHRLGGSLGDRVERHRSPRPCRRRSRRGRAGPAPRKARQPGETRADLRARSRAVTSAAPPASLSPARSRASGRCRTGPSAHTAAARWRSIGS